MTDKARFHTAGIVYTVLGLLTQHAPAGTASARESDRGGFKRNTSATRVTWQQHKPSQPFVVMTHTAFEAQVRASGAMLIDTMHLPGPWEKVAEELEGNPPSRPVTVFQCMGPQNDVLGRFNGLADQFLIFLFAQSSGRGPDPCDLVWRSFNHPLVNRVRETPILAGSARVYAEIHILGEDGAIWGMTKTRGIRFEEVQWMVFAVLGGDYCGVLWRSDLRISSWPDRLSALQTSIRDQAEDLGKACAVGWVDGPGGQPITARCSDRKLFVILLNPDYMNPSPDGKTISEPVEPADCEGQIVIRPPPGRKVESGKYLLGRSLTLVGEGCAVQVRYRFHGGGEMLVFDLINTSSDQTTSTKNTPNASGKDKSDG